MRVFVEAGEGRAGDHGREEFDLKCPTEQFEFAYGLPNLFEIPVFRAGHFNVRAVDEGLARDDDFQPRQLRGMFQIGGPGCPIQDDGPFAGKVKGEQCDIGRHGGGEQ